MKKKKVLGKVLFKCYKSIGNDYSGIQNGCLFLTLKYRFTFIKLHY